MSLTSNNDIENYSSHEKKYINGHTFYNCISYVEVVIVLITTNFGHEDGEVVVFAAFDADSKAAVRRPGKSYRP